MLKDKIKTESVFALKSRDSRKVEVLRYLISLIDKKELQLPLGEMTEADEVAVLRKELKNKEEAKVLFEKGNRNDLVEQIDYEIATVKEYLPAELSEEEIAKEVEVAMGEAGGSNFGMIMGTVMKRLAGRANGDMVSKIVKEKMGNL